MPVVKKNDTAFAGKITFLSSIHKTYLLKRKYFASIFAQLSI